MRDTRDTGNNRASNGEWKTRHMFLLITSIICRIQSLHQDNITLSQLGLLSSGNRFDFAKWKCKNHLKSSTLSRCFLKNDAPIWFVIESINENGIIQTRHQPIEEQNMSISAAHCYKLVKLLILRNYITEKYCLILPLPTPNTQKPFPSVHKGVWKKQ